MLLITKPWKGILTSRRFLKCNTDYYVRVQFRLFLSARRLIDSIEESPTPTEQILPKNGALGLPRKCAEYGAEPTLRLASVMCSRSIAGPIWDRLARMS